MRFEDFLITHRRYFEFRRKFGISAWKIPLFFPSIGQCSEPHWGRYKINCSKQWWSRIPASVATGGSTAYRWHTRPRKCQTIHNQVRFSITGQPTTPHSFYHVFFQWITGPQLPRRNRLVPEASAIFQQCHIHQYHSQIESQRQRIPHTGLSLRQQIFPWTNLPRRHRFSRTLCDHAEHSQNIAVASGRVTSQKWYQLDGKYKSRLFTRYTMNKERMRMRIDGRDDNNSLHPILILFFCFCFYFPL